MRFSLPALAALALAPALGGCVPLPSVTALRTAELDLAGPAPDVVLLSVSGRCGAPCRAPRDNWDYLSSRGTVDRLADVMTAAGYRVQARGYASNVAAEFTSPFLNVPQRGVGALQADLDRLKTGWLASPRPPRVVLLGHSHGVAWSHHLARQNPDVPVALQVDLDGICFVWNTDYADPTSPLNPPAACETVALPGGDRAVAKDVVWPNVAHNLEVQSKRLPARVGPGGGFAVNYLFEHRPNVRFDRQAGGLERFISPREDHSAVTYPNSDAMAWVAERTAEVVKRWRLQDAASGRR